MDKKTMDEASEVVFRKWEAQYDEYLASMRQKREEIKGECKWINK